MSSDVCVIGAGAFGSSLAFAFAQKGLSVCVWTRRAELAQAWNATQRNDRSWPGFLFPKNISASSDLLDAVRDCPFIVYASPSSQIQSYLKEIAPSLSLGNAFFIDTAKGIDTQQLKLHHQLAEEILGLDFVTNRYFCLSGPSFAAEILKEAPTCVTLAGFNKENAQAVQNKLGSPAFRILTSNDLIGCEIGGALKNIIAIIVGVADGLGYGWNTQAALITRGSAEIIRLGRALGAKTETFLGLSGMGDLVLTCTGNLSRNRSFGIHLGQGLSLEDAKAKVGGTIEGIHTTQAAYLLGKKHQIEMPLTETLYEFLFQGKPLSEGIFSILSRPLRDEWR